MERCYNLFPKENIKVLLFEDLIKDPIKTTQEIFTFLNVDNTFIPNTNKKANVSAAPKGLFGIFIMKLRFFNLIPSEQIRLKALQMGANILEYVFTN